MKIKKTESKLSEFAKQLEEKESEIKRLNDAIQSLEEGKNTLLAQCEVDRTKIEDLEFQIEEHKLGCVANTSSSRSATPTLDTSATAATVTPAASTSEKQLEEEKESAQLLLKQLEIQKEIAKNHQEEIKFWKEQTDTLSIEVKQLRLGEEVYAKEKSELVKSLDEIETQLRVAKQEAEENVKLKEKLAALQTASENKGELEFLYHVIYIIIFYII